MTAFVTSSPPSETRFRRSNIVDSRKNLPRVKHFKILWTRTRILTKQSYKSNVLKFIIYLISSAMVDTTLHMICIWIHLCAFCAWPQGVCSRWWMFLNFFICLLKELGSEHAKSHWLHLLYFSPVCVFKCVLKSAVREMAKSHWLHLFGFSPVCIFKCVPKLPTREDA